MIADFHLISGKILKDKQFNINPYEIAFLLKIHNYTSFKPLTTKQYQFINEIILRYEQYLKTK